MEVKDNKIGPRPDNPPPYSVEPSPTSYPVETPGPTSFPTQPPGQTSFSAVPPGSYQYATAVPPSSVTYMATPQQDQSHVFIATQPTAGAVVHTVVTVQRMGTLPTSMVCKSCNVQIVTRVEMKPTIRTHVFAIMLCIMGCWPLACVPYCIDSCYNTDHYCPNCNAYIGSYIS